MTKGFYSIFLNICEIYGVFYTPLIKFKVKQSSFASNSLKNKPCRGSLYAPTFPPFSNLSLYNLHSYYALTIDGKSVNDENKPKWKGDTGRIPWDFFPYLTARGETGSCEGAYTWKKTKKLKNYNQKQLELYLYQQRQQGQQLKVDEYQQKNPQGGVKDNKTKNAAQDKIAAQKKPQAHGNYQRTTASRSRDKQNHIFFRLKTKTALTNIERKQNASNLEQRVSLFFLFSRKHLQLLL